MFDDWDVDPARKARIELSCSARDGDPEGIRKALAKGILPDQGGPLPGRSQNTPLRLAIENLPMGDHKVPDRHQAIDVLLEAYQSHGLPIPAQALEVAFTRGDLVTAEKLVQLRPEILENPSASGGLVTLAINQIFSEKGQVSYLKSSGLQLLVWALEKGAPADGNDVDRALIHAFPLARCLGEIGSSSLKAIQEMLREAVNALAAHGATLPWNPERPTWGALYIKVLLENWPEEQAAMIIAQSNFSPEEQEQVVSALDNPWAAKFRSIAMTQRLPGPSASTVLRPRPRF